ncbi:MAG TPA: long-chain fatty acid--CoA ligase [Polyangiaceae bacterium]|nr:long-chain fatty acid--CoA ligase [Polyangiaceae bacterium]
MTEIRTLVDLFESSCRVRGNAPLFGVRREEAFHWLSYAEVHQRVARMRRLMRTLGVARGDRVALIADNSVEWAVICYAALGCGAIVVPMYTAQHAADWEYILRDSGAKILFLEERKLAKSVGQLRASAPGVQMCIAIDAPPADPNSLSARLLTVSDASDCPAEPEPDDPACYIYTSGTTGRPKGVILTHRNIVFDVMAAVSRFPINAEDRTLSFLPWAHAFGQTVDLHLMVHIGCQVALNGDVSSLLTNLRLAQPTVLVAVPRIFGRIHEVVRGQLARKPRLFRRAFDRGVAAAVRRERGVPLSLFDRISLRSAEWMIFRRIRRHFGGRLRFVISGSAALDRTIAEFVNALGIELFEGYGLTEASPVVAVNCFEHRRFGTVGRPLPGVELSIDRSSGDDPTQGEILVRGPLVMKGYHGLPEETSRTITPDGWLRTGDLGRIDEDGYLVVSGRIKEQYKLSNGKYVAPSPIEERLKQSPLVENCILYGADESFCVLIVSPNRITLEKEARARGIAVDDVGSEPEACRILQHEIAALAQEFAPYARPKKLLVVSEDFTIENGLLTPSQKVRRNAVIQRYQGRLRALYPDSSQERTSRHNTPKGETRFVS